MGIYTNSAFSIEEKRWILQLTEFRKLDKPLGINKTKYTLCNANQNTSNISYRGKKSNQKVLEETMRKSL